MQFSEPFITRMNDDLIPDLNKSFFLTAKWDRRNSDLLANIGPSGRSGLRWVLDHDGQFFSINSKGLLRKSVFDWIGLTRQKERMNVEEPHSITIGEFETKIYGTKDRFEEAPFSAQTTRLVARYPKDRTIDREIMVDLLSE